MKYGLLLAKNGNDNALAFLAALTEVLPFDIRQLYWYSSRSGGSYLVRGNFRLARQRPM
jgi:hypothetical protein